MAGGGGRREEGPSLTGPVSPEKGPEGSGLWAPTDGSGAHAAHPLRQGPAALRGLGAFLKCEEGAEVRRFGPPWRWSSQSDHRKTALDLSH